MKAAIYMRVSTPDQAEEGESLELQKERILEYIKAQNWKLFKIYEDAGLSGGSTKRPAFQELLKDTQNKLFDVVLVYKIDRLSRSIVDFFNTLQLFEKQGITFVSITQQFDTSTPTGRFAMSMLASFADFERSIGIERAKDSYLRRLKNGISSGVL
ncbi:MAG: recombinase family protein, partial [Caldiserica bacterium CG17_big_fil_post_rev_8_21_14_2_50_35_7]